MLHEAVPEHTMGNEQAEDKFDGSDPCRSRGKSHRPRILILGDGNFSFSLALSKALLLGKQQSDCVLDEEMPPPEATCVMDDVSKEEAPQQSLHESTRQQRAPLVSKEDIIATSFDGRVDLLKKYPEWISIDRKLRALGVTVLHDVDATALDARVVNRCYRRSDDQPIDGGAHQRPSLHPTDHDSRCSESDIEPHVATHVIHTTKSKQYDHVIFNHPHTGTEDLRRHRSFLGHFFHALTTKSSDDAKSRGRNGEDNVTAETSVGARKCTRQVITPLVRGGVVHVTLTGDQPERWGLCEQATRHGFVLAHRRQFPAEKIDGYMSKRHQTGKSFRQRSLESITLSFVWDKDATETDGQKMSSAGDVQAAGDEGTGSGKVSGSTKDATGSKGIAADGVSDGISTLPPWLWPGVSILEEAAHENTEINGFSSAPGAVSEGEVVLATMPKTCKEGLSEVCNICGKRYKTTQALRTHTRQFHELRQTEGGFGTLETNQLPCGHCDRVFTSEASRKQHETAKHGTNNDIKPDWYGESIYQNWPLPQNADHCGIVNNTEGNDTASSDARQEAGIAEEHEVGAEQCSGEPAQSSPPMDISFARTLYCDICGYWFADESQAHQHLENLRPPRTDASARHECSACRKEFGSRRALLQHINFCEQ